MRRRTSVRRVGRIAVLGLSFALGVALHAQDAAPGQETGSVAGRVMASDTQRPVRFAQVMLQRVATDGGRDGGSSTASTRTDAEGNFTAANVAPGDYYVTASAPGYVSERTALQAGVSAGKDPDALLAQIPVVRVTTGQSPVTVTIDRGGAVSGKVLWEDGSPATGLALSALLPGQSAGFVQLPAPLQEIQAAGGGSVSAMTDDRGVFRLTGLAAGSYVVRATIQAPQAGTGRIQQFGSAIRVYAPGVFRRAEAKLFEVKAADERNDVTMVIDLRGLHTVSGGASSISSGLRVASGRIALVDANDSDLQISGSIAADGSFAVRYVPAGSYTLRVTGASTRVITNRGRQGDDSTATTFQPFSEPITVNDTDVSGVGLTMTPVASQP